MQFYYHLISFDEEGEYGIYTLDSYSYGSPVYYLTPIPYVSQQLEQFFFGFIEVLQYRGRQWIAAVVPESDLAAAKEGINSDQHAYWNGAYFGVSENEYYYSEPTNRFMPTGSLQWYVADDTRSEGDYGPRGREISVERRYSCWSLDCSGSTNLCGKHGTCMPDEQLTFRNQPQDVWGGKCVCEEGYHGHFCEFKAGSDEL